MAGRPGPQGGGWKDFVNFWREEGKVSTTAEGYYVEQLAWYDGEMQRDDYVKGAVHLHPGRSGRLAIVPDPRAGGGNFEGVSGGASGAVGR